MTTGIAPAVRAVLDRLLRPVSPLPLAAYRCLFGLLALANGVLLAPDLEAFFGAAGVLPDDPLVRATTPWRFDPLTWAGSTPAAVWTLFAAAMTAATLTTVGLFTRGATLVLFLATVAFHHRNLYILSSGDTMMRLMAFFLALAPAGAALSLDRLRRVRRGSEPPGEPPPISPVAFRVMQLQICLAYLITGIWKAGGQTWRDGTAAALVLQLGQFARFPLPDWAETAAFSRIATWGTLGVELVAPVLLWFPATRRVALVSLAALHLGLEYALNIQLFQPVMLAGLVLFLEPDELRPLLRLAARLTGRGAAPPRPPPPGCSTS